MEGQAYFLSTMEFFHVSAILTLLLLPVIWRAPAAKSAAGTAPPID